MPIVEYLRACEARIDLAFDFRDVLKIYVRFAHASHVLPLYT